MNFFTSKSKIGEEEAQKQKQQQEQDQSCLKATNSITVRKELDLWNENQEQLLRKWGDECKAFAWKHYKACKKFKRQNKYFNVVSVCLATVAGVGAFVNVECDSWYSLGIGLTASVSAGLTTLNSRLDLGELASKHKYSYQEFSKLSKEVPYVLSFERIRRGDSSQVMSEFKEKYDKIIDESPEIPIEITEEYKNKFEIPTTK